MYLDSIKLLNYRGIHSASILNMSNRISVLYGDNNTGKSRILDSFQFLKDCLAIDISHAIKIRGGVEKVFGNNEYVKIFLKFKYDVLGNPNTYVYYELEIGFDLDNGVHIRHEAISFAPRTGADVYYFHHRSFSSMESVMNEDNVLRFGSTMIRNSFDINPRRLSLSHVVTDSGVAYQIRLFIHTMYSLSEHNLNKKTSINRDLVTTLNEVYDVNIQENPLTDGITNLLNISSLLQNKGYSFICIDQLELGIYNAKLLSLAYELIKFAYDTNTQLIITSLSPTILNAFDVEDLYNIDIEQNCVSTTKFLNISEIFDHVKMGGKISDIL